MDKCLILAKAGAGKTTYIVDSICSNKKYLIVTYTQSNYKNIRNKLIKNNNNKWPDNILLMTYFQFLYRFCYKPFRADKIKAKGITYKTNDDRYCKSTSKKYYINSNNCFYSNRLASYLINYGVIQNIRERIEKYFDEFIIDEVQDIAGRDFAFLEELMTSKVNMLFVGDFYQHTYNTSQDGNFNKNLFVSYNKYIERFSSKGFVIDTNTLKNSWRCSKETCAFIRNKLGIEIYSNRQSDTTFIGLITEQCEIDKIINDCNIIKLHYQNSKLFGLNHKNWGDTKGEDIYNDVCVMLNKKTAKNFDSKLIELPPSTLNKLYVAISRARGNVYFVLE